MVGNTGFGARLYDELCKDYADEIFLGGCHCPQLNGGGDCDWCTAYYSALNDPEILEEYEEMLEKEGKLCPTIRF